MRSQVKDNSIIQRFEAPLILDCLMFDEIEFKRIDLAIGLNQFGESQEYRFHSPLVSIMVMNEYFLGDIRPSTCCNRLDQSEIRVERFRDYDAPRFTQFRKFEGSQNVLRCPIGDEDMAEW